VAYISDEKIEGEPMKVEEKKKILLIDDDTSLLVTLGDFLKFEGYDVTAADSGEEGLKKLEKMTPDLIILDMSMPGMGGVGFLKEISSMDGVPKYPVLVLTARANMAEFFANVDVDGFISKPCEPNDLLMEVGRIVFLRSGEESATEAETKRLDDIKKKVLIGEDEWTVSEKLAESFRQAGYLVDSVDEGPEVLERAVMTQPDVVVMKIVMKGMNGDAVAGMLKELPKTKDTPVILYDDGDQDVPESRLTAVDSNIKKLVRSNKPRPLLAAIQDVLGT
jgi:CheY-like chemotaxis protein